MKRCYLLIFSLFFGGLAGAQIVHSQNGSFEDTSVPTGPGQYAYFILGQVDHWSTSANNPGSEVTSLIQCNPGTSGSQTITAFEGSDFAKVIDNKTITNHLKEPILPGQRINVRVRHRTTVCSESFMLNYIRIRSTGGSAFGVPIGSGFLSSYLNWNLASFTQDIPVTANSPCFYDLTDITAQKFSFRSAEDAPESAESFVPPAFTLFDAFEITGCEEETDDLIYYNIGTDANCATVNFSMVCNSDDYKYYFWDFGDGNTECSTSGCATTHTYLAEGTYNVKLTRVNANGCIERLEETVHVYCKGCAGLTADFGFECVNCLPMYVMHYDPKTGKWYEELVGYSCQVAFTDLSTATGSSIVSWTWTRDGSVFSSAQNPTMSLSAPPLGVEYYEICLSIVDDEGCIDQVCKTLNAPCNVFDGREVLSNPVAGPVGSGPMDFNVSPNPASDFIQLRPENLGEVTEGVITLFSLNGTLVLQEVRDLSDGEQVRLDLPSVPKGLYVLQVSTSGGMVNKKIVIR